MQIENCKLQIESRRAARRGITLVELLVVISILVILMAVASQMMNFSVDDRRTREAARAVNVYLNSARNRAIQTGRPCGVLLRTLQGRPGQPEAVVGLQQAEVPPPYAGHTIDAVAQLRIKQIGMRGPSRLAIVEWNANKSSIGDPFLIKPGDLVQFNHQGPLYKIVKKGIPMQLEVVLSAGQMLPWPEGTNAGWSAPVPYQVFRMPRKSAVAPLQLPTRAVIDLKASGHDLRPQNPVPAFFKTSTTDEPVIIMFSPTGAVDRVYCRPQGPPQYSSVYGAVRVSQPIFLLVGKQERVANPPEDASGTSPLEELPNWVDPENLWVMINPQTGKVTTAENDYVDPANVEWANKDWANPKSWPRKTLEARQIAREGQSMGGR